jgi:NADP-dependent 3-hydroxy acid dehydrogenase YdfG
MTPDIQEEHSVTNSDNIVLITGATGRQGGAVIRHMLPKGWKLRALTRNAGGGVGQGLAR